MLIVILRVSQLLSCATTLCSQESASLSLPDFPVDNLPSALTLLVNYKAHDIFTNKYELCDFCVTIKLISVAFQVNTLSSRFWSNKQSWNPHCYWLIAVSSALFDYIKIFVFTCVCHGYICILM